MTVGNRECHYPRSELKERQLRGITVHRNSRPAIAGLFTKVQVRLCSRWSVQCTYFRTSIIGYRRLHDTRKNKNSRQTGGHQCVCHRCSHPFAPHSFDQSERRILKLIGSMPENLGEAFTRRPNKMWSAVVSRYRESEARASFRGRGGSDVLDAFA